MNRVFVYFNIECGYVKAGSVNEVLDISALDENKHMADLLGEKKYLNEEIDSGDIYSYCSTLSM